MICLPVALSSELDNRIAPPLIPEIVFALARTEVSAQRYRVCPMYLHAQALPVATCHDGRSGKAQLTSVTKPKYPMADGTATTYMNVINAVRGVQRKYFHLLADMSRRVASARAPACIEKH